MKSKIIAICFFIIIALFVKGQTVSNLHFEQSGKMIEVHYDLSGKGDESFQVNLYCSMDGGKTWGNSLKYVTGEVGDNIKSGNNKIITWDALKERDKLIGEIKFKVEATPMSGCHSFTITHKAGNIAPVTKTVTYGVAETNLTGSKKCWITQNLGADRQATAATDATESSAGWYWQFNQQQGFKHDGTTRTPNTTWISSINENSYWLPVNDPCTQLLGNGWRLPTRSEWNTADRNGDWDNYNEAFASVIQLHAAGYLYESNGSLQDRGYTGRYWSSTQYGYGFGWYLDIHSTGIKLVCNLEGYGFSVRCLKSLKHQ